MQTSGCHFPYDLVDHVQCALCRMKTRLFLWLLQQREIETIAVSLLSQTMQGRNENTMQLYIRDALAF